MRWSMMAFGFALGNGVLGLQAALAGLQGGVADEAVMRRLWLWWLALVLAPGQVQLTAVWHRLAAVRCAVALVTVSWLWVASVSALLHRLA